MTTRLPTGSLVITLGRDGSTPHWEAKWRWDGRQIKRRVGHAWLDRKGDDWVKRAGRAPEGFLSEQDAIVAMRAMIAAHAAESAEDRPESVPSLRRVAERWFERASGGVEAVDAKLYRQLLDAYILTRPSQVEEDPARLPVRRQADHGRQQGRHARLVRSDSVLATEGNGC